MAARRSVLIVIGVATALACLPAAAQTGGITVAVFDAADRAPLPGATVTLTNAQRLVAPTTVLTGADGTAAFPVLRAGTGYEADVSFPGLGRQRASDIRVRSGEIVRLSFLLAPGLTERIVVVDRPPVTDLTKSSTSTRFGEDFIQDLPVQGRLYQNVLTLAAGVNDVKGEGNPNVHGARTTDFKTLVSGVSNQDPLTGEWMSLVNPDSIEEIEVITAGAGVEFGRAQGGFANIIQKQGGNTFEGVIGVFLRSSRIDGDAALGVAGAETPTYGLLQPSVQISGPIVKDRLWFRLSHEYIDRKDPLNAVGFVAVQTTQRWINSDQITWQASPRNKLSLQYQYDPYDATNLGVSSLRPPETSYRLQLGGPQYTLAWTAPVSARVLFESLVSFQKSRENILPATNGVPNTCAVGLQVPFVTLAQCTNLDTGQISGSYFREWRDERERLTLRGQGTFYLGRFLGSSHQLKAGVSVEDEQYTRDLVRRPNITFTVTRSSFFQEALVVGNLAVPDRSRARATGSNWAFWIEDQVKPASNLTVTFGLRVDRESLDSVGYRPFDPSVEAVEYLIRASRFPPGARSAVVQQVFTAFEGMPSFVELMARSLSLTKEGIDRVLSPNAVQSLFWSNTRRPEDVRLRNTNVAPRLSLAWDPTADGKTKLSLSAGRYYDKIFLAIPLVELEPVTTSLTLRAFRLSSTRKWVVDRLEAGLNPAVGLQVVDRGLTTPFQDELTVALEREIFPETVLKATYIHRRFRNQLQNIDLNHYGFDYGSCQTQPGPGRPPVVPPQDGKLDDCAGDLPNPFSGAGRYPIPDGYVDTYVYNPGWGAIFQVGNYNSATYKAFVLEVVRRQFRNWQMEASYTYSRATGEAEDFNSFLGDDRTTLDAERGDLSYDQRHVVKINATVVTPWGFRLGGTASWQSGLPYSIVRQSPSWDASPPQYEGLGQPEPRVRIRYVTGQRNDQRNRSFWTVNAKLDREFALGRETTLRLAAEVFNLFNERTYTVYNTFLGYGLQVNGNNDAYRRIGRQFQLSLQLAF